MGVPDAGGDLDPVGVVGDAFLEPAGVVLKVVVEVGAVEEGSAGALVGDGVGEDDEAEEGGDDGEHGEEVEAHEEGVAVAGAGKAGEGEDHDGGADDDEGPLEEAQAVAAVGAAAQPEAASQDGDGQQEREEVHRAYYVVARSHDDRSIDL